MKAVKKLIQIVICAIGILTILLCSYFVIHEPQTVEKFVLLVMISLSFVISFFVNGCIQWVEDEGDNDDEV